MWLLIIGLELPGLLISYIVLLPPVCEYCTLPMFDVTVRTDICDSGLINEYG